MLGLSPISAAPLAAISADTIGFIFLRPDTDDSIGAWSDEGGGTTNIFQSIDEVIANDSDFIRSEIGPEASKYKVRLSNPGVSIDTDETHAIDYRYQKADAISQIDLTVRLIQGASTVIASWSHMDISDVIAEANQTLSAGEIANITDYDDLFLEFEMNTP